MPSRTAANGTNSHSHSYSQGPYTLTSDMYHKVTYEPGSHDNPAYENDVRLDFDPIDNGDICQTRQQQITPSVITKQPSRNRRLCWIIVCAIVIIVITVGVVLIVYFTTKKESVSGGVPTTTTPRTTTPRPADVKGSFRLKSATYVTSMADVNSDAFKGIATKYQPLINRIFKASKLATVVKYSVINGLRRGSVIVEFDVYLEDSITEVTVAALREAFQEGLSYLLANEPDLQAVLLDIIVDSLLFEGISIVTASTTIKPSSGTTSGGQQPGQFPSLAEPCGVAGRTARRRIVGGNSVVSGRYPWMVVIRFGSVAHCGGSIIDARHVISAAHCFLTIDFPGIDAELNVMAGEVTLSKASTSSTAQIVNVTRMYKHKDFNKKRVGTVDSNLNDMAVLRLERNLTFNSYVSPICLPQPNATLPSRCTVAGWGSVSISSKTFAPDMLAVTMWTYSSAQCGETFGQSFNMQSHGDNITGYLSDGIMCAANRSSGGQDACFGDSGGPLFCETLESGGTAARPRYAQFGIVSWGEGCGAAGAPGFYAYVPYFRPWLHRVAFPLLDYQSTIPEDSLCLNVAKCGAHLKNATYTPDTLTNCQRFANAVSCSVANPTVPGACEQEDAETEVRQYVKALNLEFERTVLDVTSCQLP